jgi:hypothetical protein
MELEPGALIISIISPLLAVGVEYLYEESV